MPGDLTCPHGHLRPANGAAPPDCPICSKERAHLGDAPAGGAKPARPSAVTVRVRSRRAALSATRTSEQTPVPADAQTGPQPWPVIAGYEILAELGRGGMGVVYKARQTGLNRIVAIKMIGTGPATNANMLARFRSEAEVIARLQQPNIVQVYDIGTCPAGPYFAMEYAEGGNLADRWAGLPQPTRAVARDVGALALAVQAAHEQGIIHRDIKPANILLAYVSGSQRDKNDRQTAGDGERRGDRELVPKISDFGLARRLNDPRGLTLTGQVMGTPGYMAPEQARGTGEDAGTAVDIYALGVLLYEALTGSTPYRGASALESVHLMLSEEPLPPSRLRPGLPRDLETICLHCLEKDPRRRYATAGLLADDLEHFLAGEPIRARPTPVWERAWKWTRRHPLNALLTSALVMTVAVAYSLVLWQWHRAEEERQLTDDARRGALTSATAERQARDDAQVLSANLLLERGVSLCEAGDYGPGLLWLARVLDAAPTRDRGLRRSARLLLGGWGEQLRLPNAVIPLGDEIEAAALSPDGRLYAAAIGSRVILRAVDASDGCCPPLLHGGPVTAVTFSPDGGTLLTASADGTARLWDVTTGQPRGEPLRHKGAVAVVIFGSNGKVVLSAGAGGEARLWDAVTGQPRSEWLEHGSAIASAALSPDCGSIATGGVDGILRVWDVSTGKDKFGALCRTPGVQAIAFSPGGDVLAASSADNETRLWDVASGRLLHRLGEHTAPVRALAFSPDGKTLATGSDDRRAILWDVSNGAPRARLLHRETVRQVIFSPGGKALATGSGDYTARLWAADNGRPLGGPLPHQGNVNAVTFGPDGRTLLTAGDDGMIRVWPTDPPGVSDSLVPRLHVHGLSVSPNGKTLLVRFDEGKAGLLDIQTGARHDLANDAGTLQVAFSADGASFLTVNADHSVRFWDTASGMPATTGLAPGANALTAAFSPDGKLVATGSDDEDCTVRIWDRATGSLLRTLRGHKRKVVAVVFSPDGRCLVSGSWDRTARLWHVNDGSPVTEPLRHQDLVQTAAFSPDSKAVVTGSDDYTARLWDVATGKPLATPLRHGEKISMVGFSPDGSILLTIGQGGTAVLWDRLSAKPLGPGRPSRGGVRAGAFAADGRTFFTAGREGVIRRWTVPEPLEGEADTIWNWLYAHTGLKLDAGGAATALAPNAYFEQFSRWKGLNPGTPKSNPAVPPVRRPS
jgi:WD40 repeat protein/serine/threonine protein kinase